jgi:serine/threonine protein kinase
MPLEAGTFLGPYEVVGLLGEGGMGHVYRARDPRLGRDVAIKVLPAASSTDPGRLSRFEHEARAAAALNHPNILAVYDAVERVRSGPIRPDATHKPRLKPDATYDYWNAGTSKKIPPNSA